MAPVVSTATTYSDFLAAAFSDQRTNKVDYGAECKLEVARDMALGLAQQIGTDVIGLEVYLGHVLCGVVLGGVFYPAVQTTLVVFSAD